MAIEVLTKKPALRTTDIVAQETPTSPMARFRLEDFFTEEERKEMVELNEHSSFHNQFLNKNIGVYFDILKTKNVPVTGKSSEEEMASHLDMVFYQDAGGQFDTMIEARHYYPELIRPPLAWKDQLRQKMRRNQALEYRPYLMQLQTTLVLADPETEIPLARQNPNLLQQIQEGISSRMENPYFFSALILLAQIVYPGKIKEHKELVDQMTYALEEVHAQAKGLKRWSEAIPTAFALAALEADGIELTESGFHFILPTKERNRIPAQPEVKQYAS